MKQFYLFIATLFSTISLAQANNALHFDGVDDYVSTTKSSIQGNTARSYEAWIRTNENCIPGSSGGVQQVIADMGTFINGKRFTLNLLWANSVRLEIGGTGISGTVAVNDSLWHHVAAVYDPTASKKVTLYVDGLVCGTGNFTATPSTSAGNVVIGRRVDGANPFGGDIDEFRLWNVALTDADVLAHMNGEICAPSNNLVLYYTMNAGVADGSNTNTTTLTDQSGSNNGTLQNFSLSGSSSNWTYGQNLSQTVYDTIVATACSQYMIPDSSGYWDSTGTYTWTFNQATGASAGCDSIVTYDLTIDTVDNRINQNGIVLSSPATNASFQWVNCDDSTDIVGYNTRVYPVQANGSYAVKVTQGNCTEWSDCITITTVGIDENNELGPIYPNPTEGVIYVPIELVGETLIIADIAGNTVAKIAIESSKVELPEGLSSGMYILRSGWQQAPKKIILQR
jgi:hypothetical protein